MLGYAIERHADNKAVALLSVFYRISNGFGNIEFFPYFRSGIRVCRQCRRNKVTAPFRPG